ncbi:DUF6471 domain-containing protein [Pseudorhodoferax soli]|uniref:DUF6471 domain-containing protein n=1 Tax=Pseudorhodoferax soli TaxID=545864 RepID=UPI002482F636|nr:DUF6471 domain-containing protein [Pseudorhodoferax soli]
MSEHGRQDVVPFSWPDAASRLLRSEMALAGVTSAVLARRISELGSRESEASVKNKIHRGTFSLAFFLQAMAALGRAEVPLGRVWPPDTPIGQQLDHPNS